MATKMTQKHIGFSDSIVMKELEKIAVKDKLIEFEKKPEIQAKASTELKETGDVFMDSITLAESLREKGFNKQAALLEKRALEYKEQTKEGSEQYNWWEEDGDSFLEFAHKNDYHEPLPSSNDYGRVEDEIGEHKKIMQSVERQPTGKTASDKKKIINEINRIAQEAEGGGTDVSVINAYKVIGQQLNNLKALYPTESKKSYKWGGEALFKVATRWVNEYNKSKLLQKLIDKGVATAFLGTSPAAYQASWQVQQGQLLQSPHAAGTFVKQYGNLFPNIKPPPISDIGVGDNKNGETDKYKQSIIKVYDKLTAMYNALTNAVGQINIMLKTYHSNMDKIIGEYNAFNPETIFAKTSGDVKIDAKSLLDPIDKVAAEVNKTVNIEIGNSLLEFLGIANKSPEAALKGFNDSVTAYKTAVYNHPKIGQLGTTFKDVGFGVDVLNGSVDNALSNWNTILSKLKSLPNWENDKDFVKMVNEASDNVNKLSTIKSALEGVTDDSPYGLLYSRISKITNQTSGGKEQSIGTDVGSFFGFVNAYARDGKVVSEVIDKVIEDKTKEYRERLEESKRSLEELSKRQSEKFDNVREARSDPSLFGAGGGTKPTGTGTRPTGKGRGAAPKKQSDALKNKIALMQDLQGKFASYASTIDISEEKDPAVVDAIHTAKDNLRGANKDGVWGPNTQASLESIQKYIDANPALKNRIEKKIHSAKPAGESESQIAKNVKNNVIIMGQGLALLGDSKYARLLPSILKAGGFDNIPKMYTVPTKGDTESFMPVEGGIKISARELSSLGQLKGYLDSKGYTTASASGIGEV